MMIPMTYLSVVTGVYDLRSSTAVHRSDEQESELQCLAVIKGGSKVLCGTQDGVILVRDRTSSSLTGSLLQSRVDGIIEAASAPLR